MRQSNRQVRVEKDNVKRINVNLAAHTTPAIEPSAKRLAAPPRSMETLLRERLEARRGNAV